jgi:hypothetical protein
MYTFIHNMNFVYVADYKTCQVTESSSMDARGVGYLRDGNK